MADERAMKTKPAVLDPLARALETAERPARERQAAEQAQQDDARQTEQRQWRAVVIELLAAWQPMAAQLERWRASAPAGGAQQRDRYFTPRLHEAMDRVLTHHQGLEEMVARAQAQLHKWHDELAAPARPERLGVIVEGVRGLVDSRRAAMSGLAAAREIRAQAVPILAEARAAVAEHEQWLSGPAAAEASPKEAA